MSGARLSDMVSGSYARGMRISRKLCSLTAAALLVGLTLSACGDKDGDKKDDAAGDKTSSSSAASGTTLTKANFTKALSTSQAKAKSAHVDMTIDVGGQSVKAQGDVAVGSTVADSAMTMTMDMGSAMKVDMRLVDEALYINMGQMTQDKFVKVDLTDQSNPLAQQFGQLTDQMDPSKQLAELEEAVTSFEKKGEPETIDGVQAQPYAVTVDTSKLKALADLPSASTSQLPKTIDYTMYVGSDDLLRRMEFDLAGSKAQMDYSKWGEPVDILAPPADEVSDQDLSELMGGGVAPAA